MKFYIQYLTNSDYKQHWKNVPGLVWSWKDKKQAMTRAKGLAKKYPDTTFRLVQA